MARVPLPSFGKEVVAGLWLGDVVEGSHVIESLGGSTSLSLLITIATRRRIVAAPMVWSSSLTVLVTASSVISTSPATATPVVIVVVVG